MSACIEQKSFVRSAYSLPSHVHACATDDGLVFLDLRANRYIGLNSGQGRLLSAVVSSLDAANVVDATECTAAALLADELVQNGLLVKGKPHSARGADVRAPIASAELLEPAHPHIQTASLSEWTRMLRACAWTYRALHVRSFEFVVEEVRARKSGVPHETAAASIEHIRESIGAFFWMRTFLYSDKTQCLFDTLCLIRFLALERIFPIWIIGVKTRPFSAHTWLQIDDQVLNGLPEYVREFTPILVI